MKRGKQTSKEKNILKPTKKKAIIIGIIAIVIIGLFFSCSKGKTKNTVAARETDIVTRGDITVTITGSAAVEPYERFEIIPKVSGDILYCPYEVGDIVNEDDVLYRFDTESFDLNMERQEISLRQSQNSYEDALKQRDDLTIKAKASGIISGLNLKVGEDVNQGAKIATISDTENMEVVLPFTGSQIDYINVGDYAQITSSKHMSTVDGVVTGKSLGAYADATGTLVYNVTVSFKNPGALYEGLEVGGRVGDYIASGGGAIRNSAASNVTAEVSGTVKKVNFSDGDYVQKGEVIAVMTSESVEDRIEDSTLSFRSANLQMEQTVKEQENYNITSPISGTVITKNAKAGDTIDKTNSTQTLMVVADISKLKFDLSIDELDVSKVNEGQAVTVTCDALPGETFDARITNVSVEGTAQNGVTTYNAEVVIDNPGNLRPSMNIDASIIIESAQNVLMVPSGDVKSFGQVSFVYAKDDGSNSKVEKKSEGENTARNAPQGERTQGGMPEGAAMQGERPQNSDGKNGKNQPRDITEMLPEAPEGYVAVIIEKGISNEDYTEVKSGLSEGQEIYRQSATTGNNSMMGMMGGMPMGGGMSGGMPMGGGMSGGMGGSPGGMR